MGEKRIKYPIGIQTFREIVEGGHLYISLPYSRRAFSVPRSITHQLPVAT